MVQAKHKPDTAYLMDANFHLHRVHHTTHYEAKDPALNVCTRLLGMLCKEALAVKAKSVMVCLDGNDVFRYKLDPQYKANREHSDGPSPYDHVDYLISYFGLIGIPICHKSAYEADDLMCSGAANHPGPVVLGTRDKDMFQFLSDRVCMFSYQGIPPVATYMRAHDIHAHFGVPPELCLDYQMLVGDKVDNVPVLVSAAKARRGLLEHGSFQAWWKADKGLRKLLDPERVRLNRKLVKMVDTLDVKPFRPVRSKEPNLPASYHALMDFIYPKTKSLF